MRAAGIAILAACLTLPAAAEPPEFCLPYDAMAEGLRAKYGEAPVVYAIQADGNLFELWSSPETWTALRVRPADKLACIAAYGTALVRAPDLGPLPGIGL